MRVRGRGCDNRLRWVGRRWMRLRNRTFPNARVGDRVDIVRATTPFIELFCPAVRKGRDGRRRRRGGAASGNIPLRHVAFGIAVIPIGNRDCMRKPIDVRLKVEQCWCWGLRVHATVGHLLLHPTTGQWRDIAGWLWCIVSSGASRKHLWFVGINRRRLSLTGLRYLAANATFG